MLGVGIAAALWWSYFDVVTLVAERRSSTRGWGGSRVAIVVVALLRLATPVAAIVTLAIVLAALIVYENVRFAELRVRLRHQVEEQAAG